MNFDNFFSLGIGVNPVLQDQIRDVLNFKFIKHSNKWDVKKSFVVLMYSLKLKHKNFLIYNTSILNILLCIILKIRLKKVIFHLHDPIPHSGILNPIIFLINYSLVFLSDDVCVFSEKLKLQVQKIYFKKKCHIVTHGSLRFNFINKFLNEKRVVVGFFGRNMPYKNYQKFVDFVKSNPNIFFVTVGQGYPKINLKNHKLFSGVIEKDLYFSLMASVDYVFFSHSQISYSGILNDVEALNKSLLVDEKNYTILNYKKKYDFNKVSLIKQRHDLNNVLNGWDQYKHEVLQIINI
tara:strand:+ start:1799 stop:2677 length:879 start_codon:yes stop_codon:yes gene_type:complete